MTALQFDKCCCCINLRIGALILGYLGIIGSIIDTGIIGMEMTGVTNEHGYVVKLPAEIGIPIIILNVISLVFYPLLLAGVYQRKPSLVKAAWIYTIVETLLATVLQLCNSDNHNALAIIVIIIVLCLSIYWAICVRSYELALKEEGLSRPNQGGHV